MTDSMDTIRHNERMSHTATRDTRAYVVTQSGKVTHMGTEPRHYVIARTSRPRKRDGRIKF